MSGIQDTYHFSVLIQDGASAVTVISRDFNLTAEGITIETGEGTQVTLSVYNFILGITQGKDRFSQAGRRFADGIGDGGVVK